jgi:hypothetical protein
MCLMRHSDPLTDSLMLFSSHSLEPCHSVGDKWSCILKVDSEREVASALAQWGQSVGRSACSTVLVLGGG